MGAARFRSPPAGLLDPHADLLAPCEMPRVLGLPAAPEASSLKCNAHQQRAYSGEQDVSAIHA